MKKYTVHIILAVVIIVLAVVIGCKYFNKGDNSVSSNSVATAEPIATATPEPTEAPHEHVYAETITTEATCETNGLKTFSCECGDTYTEPIIAMGHVFGEYIYNEDATYFNDGTQTAQCKNCEVTDTGTAFGSMLKYTFTSMNVTMYAQQTVNVRNLPCTDGEKIDSLSTNTEVLVTGQCIETGWYEIEVRGYSAYVSDSYLGENKVQSEENFVTPETNNPGNGGNTGGSGNGGGSDMELGNSGLDQDGGNTVGDAVINDPSSGGSGGNGNGNAVDGWGNNEGNDGGDIVGDAVINP